MSASVIRLLDRVVARQAVTSKYRGGNAGGFASSPPINLEAMDVRDRLIASPSAELEAMAWQLIERPAKLPLGACPECGAQVAADFDRVSAECRGCGEHIQVADAWKAAYDYASTTWLTPAGVALETSGWGSPVSASRVRQWRCRGQITASSDGRYRLLDILGCLDRLDRTPAVA